MSTQQLPIIPPTLPSGWCPSSYQELLNKFAESIVQFQIDGSAVAIVSSSSTPTATDRNKLWWHTTKTRLFHWDSSKGAWVSKHPYAATDPVRLLWEGSTAALETFDGGSAGTPQADGIAGPMWEVDTEYEGRVPIGAGTIPGRTITPTSTAVGDELGLAEVTQTTAQVAPHQHDFTGPALTGSLSNSGDNATPIPSLPSVTSTTQQNQSAASPMENIPPARAVHIIKRTLRAYYVG